MRVVDLGCMQYSACHQLMLDVVRAIMGGAEDVLFMVEHPHVITMGRRPAWDLVGVSADRLAHLGVALCQVERGGLVTYHGPGQLVVYPVLHLPRRHMGVRQHVGILEETAQAVADAFGVSALCRPGLPGVWTEDGRKLASVGVAVRRGVAYHGLALNVGTDLDFFDLINPCGLGCSMTSLARETGRFIPLDEVKAVWLHEWQRRLPPLPRENWRACAPGEIA